MSQSIIDCDKRHTKSTTIKWNSRVGNFGDPISTTFLTVQAYIVWSFRVLSYGRVLPLGYVDLTRFYAVMYPVLIDIERLVVWILAEP